MQQGKDMRRTGVYRVSGNMGDLQLELKLRHISEWLPVPKFEYVGAQSASGHGDHHDHYPRSEGEIWQDCLIHVPQGVDSYGGANRLGYYCSYYNMGNAGNFGNQMLRRRSPISQTREEEGVEDAEDPDPDPDPAPAPVTDSESQSNPSWSIFSENSRLGGDLFYERNKELCNGGIATIRISWQQKHFSRAELERHKPDPGGCASKLQRRYHNWALETLELQQQYLRKLENQENENTEPVTRVRRRVRKSKCRQKSAVSLVPLGIVSNALSSANMSDISQHCDPNFAARTCLIHTVVDGDAEDIMPEEARNLHEKGYQLMYIYADLQQDTLLVSLQYDPEQGLLYVYPDFSGSAQDLDYVLRIERDNDCRQLYAYGFENATPLEVLKEDLFLEQEQDAELADDNSEVELPAEASALEILEYYHERRAASSERRNLLQFEMPPKRMRRVSLLLELQEAQHFENPNIHVRYYLKPPANTLWEAAPGEDPMQGATATCRNAGDWRTAHLGHCWQVTLLCEEQHQPTDLLHLYFEVVSIDGWQRERCEGYAHYAISLTTPSSCDSMRLQCIRPLGTWLDALNRYFIGGRQLFDFVSYFDVHEQYDLHSRMDDNAGAEMAMTTTGSLLLRLQKLQQRQVEPASQLHFHLDLGDSSDDNDDDEGDKSGSNADTSRATTLDEVMAAYVEARERIESLLEAR
ncbi:Meckel syndrome type 1 protein homolog [Drosophila elegans]|uniref:Meckel syndrome type 1 protein homolog n=1 Tax=Drosophila elegans TaxID=30023 RepID=UPI0007E8A50D|nr:Meckel syndrome type 1 protein homolog [Drosophila elegans]